jgi:hypothetical protein
VTTFLTGNEAIFSLPIADFRSPNGKVNDESRTTTNGDFQLWPLKLSRQFQNPQSEIRTQQFPVLNPKSAIDVRQSTIRMKLVGANANAAMEGVDRLPGISNYFIGNDPKKWRTRIPHYAKVKYRQVYPGIDLVYHSERGNLEYDFVVSPGADVGAIQLAFEGVDKTQVSDSGDLRLQAADLELRQHAPLIYQELAGRRQSVTGRYVIRQKGRVGFDISSYDLSKVLVIDPVLTYSTYLPVRTTSMDIDSVGNIYLAGSANSDTAPITPGAFQTRGQLTDAYMAKFNPQGTTLIYATYLGGDGIDQITRLAIDSARDAYLLGHTTSQNFPTTPGAFQTALRAGDSRTGDLFVTKLNGTGTALTYSTYIGGDNDEEGRSIKVNSSGEAYVSGSTKSENFPTTPGAYQMTYKGECCCVPVPYRAVGEAFVTKVNATGTGLVYSTFLGGSSSDAAGDMALDSLGQAYVVGVTLSQDFPVTAGAFRTSPARHAGNRWRWVVATLSALCGAWGLDTTCLELGKKAHGSPKPLTMATTVGHHPQS